MRLPATNDCAIIWPPNVRIGFLLGCEPTNVSSSTAIEVEYRQQLVEVGIGLSLRQRLRLAVR